MSSSTENLDFIKESKKEGVQIKSIKVERESNSKILRILDLVSILELYV